MGEKPLATTPTLRLAARTFRVASATYMSRQQVPDESGRRWRALHVRAMTHRVVASASVSSEARSSNCASGPPLRTSVLRRQSPVAASYSGQMTPVTSPSRFARRETRLPVTGHQMVSRLIVQLPREQRRNRRASNYARVTLDQGIPIGDFFAPVQEYPHRLCKLGTLPRAAVK